MISNAKHTTLPVQPSRLPTIPLTKTLLQHTNPLHLQYSEAFKTQVQRNINNVDKRAEENNSWRNVYSSMFRMMTSVLRSVSSFVFSFAFSLGFSYLMENTSVISLSEQSDVFNFVIFVCQEIALPTRVTSRVTAPKWKLYRLDRLFPLRKKLEVPKSKSKPKRREQGRRQRARLCTKREARELGTQTDR